MLKRYQKKKKEIFSSPNAFLGAKLAKNKEKMSKNEFSLLIISICRIYPKMYYHFYYKEDSKMWSEETNIKSTILGLRDGAGMGGGGGGGGTVPNVWT